MNAADDSITTVDDTYEEKDDKVFKLSIINTNARSLCPKIDSLITCFDELDLSFAVITETWFKDSVQLEDDLIDLRGRAGLGMLTKNRPPQ